MNRSLILGLLVVVAGCEAEIEKVELAKEDINPIDVSPMDNLRVTAPEVALCNSGRTYTGFGGTELTYDRAERDVGYERARAKPFSALLTEYPRVLGTTPALLAQSETTFGTTAARWYTKGDPNAVSLYQAYRIAFQGCLTVTGTDAKYAATPTMETAKAECAAWASKFWGRAALGPELEACATVIGQYAVKETQVRRRWAHGCASVLTSSDFLTF